MFTTFSDFFLLTRHKVVQRSNTEQVFNLSFAVATFRSAIKKIRFEFFFLNLWQSNLAISMAVVNPRNGELISEL
jgi:hypothetical protein